MLVQKLAGADHTTLLLNCYTKLKDVSKLDAFLRGSEATEGSSSLPFDAETAVKVGFRVSPQTLNLRADTTGLPVAPHNVAKAPYEFEGCSMMRASLVQTSVFL